ncbi:MAG: hypothetical protein LBU18_00920 [Treponema sp.]|nr:hypothetical protein [Treponema sp.]
MILLTRIKYGAVSLLLSLLSVSCGMEDYLYLYPVPAGNINKTLNTLAVFNLPDIDLDNFYYFTCFTIYYRIYISDIDESGAIAIGNLSRINSSLASDYAAFEPYTNSDTTISTSMATIFKNRSYYTLTVFGDDLDSVLSKSRLNTNGNRLADNSVTIDFSPAPGALPVIVVNGTSYPLYRSNGDGAFEPAPQERYFRNTAELNRSENIKPAINADVVDKSDISGTRYAYVSMYIVVTGTDPNYTAIYSQPTHVSFFRLPE